MPVTGFGMGVTVMRGDSGCGWAGGDGGITNEHTGKC